MQNRFTRRLLFLFSVLVSVSVVIPAAWMAFASVRDAQLNQELSQTLAREGFTGRIESTLEPRLGRPINRDLADIGRLLWFDTITGLNDDNTCGGCHSPTAAFGDTQSIAIGIESNGIVGPHRVGPRNMRRTPTVINTAFYPRLMWNSRFASMSNDPFDNSLGFQFPEPEGNSLSNVSHLLIAQAFIPPTERNEVAGFEFQGDSDAIRAAVLKRLNENEKYRKQFGNVFVEVKQGAPITFKMFGEAIAEFEFTLTFANAPVDRFARGEFDALSEQEKKGALLFFGKANCVQCHAVAGTSNEMFSDFQDYVIGVPPLMPLETNSAFDGADTNQDFGKAQVTGDSADRYKFRASPLRNVALQPTFMHNGAFTRLEDAIHHHLDVRASLQNYSPTAQMLADDLCVEMGPIEPLLARIDPRLAAPIVLSADEFNALVAFVRNGLLDPRASPENLRYLIPPSVPSARKVLTFEFP